LFPVRTNQGNQSSKGLIEIKILFMNTVPAKPNPVRATERDLEKPGQDVPAPTKRPYRLAIVFPRAQPYFCKFFQRLAAHPEIDLTVYFYSDLGMGGTLDPGYSLPLAWDVDMWSGYKHRFPRNYSPWSDLSRFAGTFHPSLLWELNKHRYDVVLMQGWWGVTTWLVLGGLLARRAPVMMYSDKSEFDSSKGLRRNFRNRLLRALFKRIGAFLTIGRSNANFYRGLGVPENKLFVTPLAVDNDFYRAERQRLLPERAMLRAQGGIPIDGVVILVVSRLLATKGIKDLISAFAILPEEGAHLLIVGDGPQRTELEDFVSFKNVPRVHFAGFQNYTQVPSHYAISDVFVLPSYHDMWGAVINEAMNFSLPIVASRETGAVADLVEHGLNGLLFDYGDIEKLAAHLGYLVAHPEERHRMGEQSAERIASWNFDRGIEGFLAALQFVKSQPRPLG